jgi:hypothetical protein
MLPATTIFATPAGPWARISDPRSRMTRSTASG